jgi:hypothetical protein
MLHVLHTHMHDGVELEIKLKTKNQIGKMKLVTLPQLQPVVAFLSEIEILHCTHR